MVEVLMGMLLLALATFAVINGLEGAQATGKRTRQRSVAAALAQQDIERLRAYPITSLVELHADAHREHRRRELHRRARRPSGSGTPPTRLNCTDQTGEADYLKISSTVKSPAQRNPVKEVSLLTPAAGVS